MSKIESFDFKSAAAIALVLLFVSFIILLIANVVSSKVEKRVGA